MFENTIFSLIIMEKYEILKVFCGFFNMGKGFPHGVGNSVENPVTKG